ncbi:hypothetical protein [Sphingomonas sp. LaA6.9]|uniref:hypothetical protein n=1 Tax=Sphingomonas sp. LaA6.9 TaxID=2919914 RepID=UPI001F4FD596|nr:hypothetical protein [Sphingomonas sp. LaA6.9]MCJ8156391.1 hypothetical protein [Sphingomonas sp. LaA6.9]
MHMLRNACCLFALVVAGEAVAQDDLCPALRKLQTLAPSDFGSIDGGPIGTSGMDHATTMKLPRAQMCGISAQPDKHAEYWCKWESTEDSFERRLTSYGKAIGTCLGAPPERVNEWTIAIRGHGVEFMLDGGEDLGWTELLLYVEAQ